jgi:hypothetical protein
MRTRTVVLLALAGLAAGLATRSSRGTDATAAPARPDAPEGVLSGRFEARAQASGPDRPVIAAATFANRLAAVPAPGDLRLRVISLENARGAPVVLRGGGFQPDRDGFALRILPSAAGEVVVSGHYELRVAGA